MSVLLVIVGGVPPANADEGRPFASHTGFRHVMIETGRAEGQWPHYSTTAESQIRRFLKSQNIRSVEDYLRWLRANVAYEADGKTDQWSGPSDTLQKRQGDCEDLALLSHAVLTGLGYSPKVMAIEKRNRSKHAVCVFQEGERFSFMDNRVLVRTTDGDFPRLCLNLLRRYEGGRLFQIQPRERRIYYLQGLTAEV